MADMLIGCNECYYDEIRHLPAMEERKFQQALAAFTNCRPI
jgi:hypothetical protein